MASNEVNASNKRRYRGSFNLFHLSQVTYENEIEF